MVTRKKILLPRSDIPNRAPTVNEIDFGEIAVNTHDGKAFIKRDANGEVTIQSIGSEEVENVYYVSKSGDYGNDGRSLMNSMKTLDSAVAAVLTKQGFKFNKDVCERDLQLIMDAIRYDMVLETNFNSVTAGLAYKRGNAGKVTGEQKYQTRRAINEERVGMLSAPLIASNPTATARVGAGFTELIDIFYDGEPDDFYFTDPPIQSQTDANTAATILQDNRAAIQDAVLSYLNNANVQPYDSVKCERDIGLILDAIVDDLVTSSDYRTITAANAYLRANSAYVLSDQFETTVAALEFAKAQTQAVVGVASDSIVATMFDRAINVINGTTTTYPAPTYPTTGTATYQTADRIAATTALQANRATLVSDTTAYITANYPTLDYDSASCERDVGYIIDGLSHDVKYGGNNGTRVNAEAYFVGTESQLGFGEGTATVAAYNDLKTRINVVVTTASEQTYIGDLIDEITGVITAGNVTGLASAIAIDLDGYLSGVLSERTFIQAAKITIQEDTIEYVDNNFAIKNTNIKSYDAGKCSRDVGIILDAVRRDFILGTDYWTITAGNSYLRANTAYLKSEQNYATIEAVKFARDTVKALQNGIPATDVFSTGQQTTLDTLFQRVIDVIDGTVTTPITAITYPTAGDYASVAGRDAQAAQIKTNRGNLIIALTSFIGTTYPGFTYNQASCEADTGFIIDGLIADLLYGGNTATRQAAFAYYVGAVSQLGAGEDKVTIAAYNDLATNIKAFGGVTEDARVDELIAIITTVIEDGDTNSLLTNEVEISTTGLTTTEYDVILSATSDIQKDTLAYVDKTFVPELPDYDQVKCYRDVGLILDAVKRDLLTGSTYNTITAGFAYLRANSAYVLSDQLEKTLQGIIYARDEVKDLGLTASDASIDVLFARVTDVLNGFVTTYETPTYPSPGGTHDLSLNGDRITAVSNLQQNRSAAISALITYIDAEYPALEYNSSKCERDAGYIIDAICHDILYSGNTAARQNAASYFVGTVGQLGPFEVTATIAGYEAFKTILGGSVLSLDATLQTEIDASLDIIINVITAGNLENLPAESEIATLGLTTTDFDAITAATLQIQDDTILFINDLYFNPAYDPEKCARDIGLIVDALSLFILTQSDAPDRFVALSYRRPSAQNVYLKQRAATLAAVNYAEDLLKTALTNGGGDPLKTDDPFERIREGINAGIYTSGVDRAWVNPNTSLYNGTAGGVDNTGSTANTIAAQNALNLQNNAYADAVIDYVNNTLGITSFDNTICKEDLIILLQALAYDVDTGTNWCLRQFAESYFTGVVNALGNDSAEVEATIAAYEYLKTYLTTNLPIDANLAQGTDQTASIIAYLTSEIDIVINAIKDNGIQNMPALVLPSTAGELAIRADGFNAVQTAKVQTQNAVIDFVNDSNPVDAFDDEKCARDTLLIIDAVCLDLLYQTNYNSITAGLAYRRGNATKVKSDQLKYTVLAINYVRDLINGTSGIAAGTKTYVTARVKEITELLEQSTDYGKEDGDPITYSNVGIDRDKINAANALRANRRQFQKEITTWLQVNYDTFEYDPDACERDVGYIVDGLVHDILYDLSYATETIARSYWVETDLNIENNPNQSLNLDGVADVYKNQLGQGEITTTIAAYNQLKTIIKASISTITEQDRVDTLLTVVNDSIGAADNTGIPNTTLVFGGDSLLIQSEKTVYKDNTVLYANQIFPAYTYNQSKCRRDVGFILDALTYDIKYGGNSATSIAMRSYFSVFNNGYGDLLGQNEFTMTIKAYKQLKRVILTNYLDTVDAGINTTKNNLLDIIINAIVQTNAGTFQLGDFFGADRSLDLYQYNYPTGLQTGYDTLVFPDLIALGHKVTYNDLYLAHQEFNVGASERLTIIRATNAVADNQGTDSTIFLKSGDYIVNNPIKLPPKTSIIGDALRSTTIRPKNVDSDIFWADNGVYIKEITFRDHQDGAAVLAFDPRVDSPGAGPFITQSPYVQNCTSLTSSGIGLRIDGSKVSGLRSMVLDAFTQFNAGGTGVHLLNRGYSQLVSLFTVSTTTSVLAETGGQCSLTNSNSSFGERGLVARGGSPSLYNGGLHANYIQNDDVIRVNSVITQDSADYTLNIGDYKKPNYNDAIKFDSDNFYYTIVNVSDEITQDWGTTGNTTETVALKQTNTINNTRYGASIHMSADDDYAATGQPSTLPGELAGVEISKRDIVGGVPQWDFVTTINPAVEFGTNTTSDLDFGTQTRLNHDGSYLMVSAPSQKNVDGSGGAQNNGALYAFRRDAETWTQSAVIKLPEVADRSRFFGNSFDMSETGLWLAASTNNDLIPGGQGAVYIFNRTAPESNTWTETQKILIPDGTGASADEPEVTINDDGSDLLIHWKGIVNKVYYYQKNIDNLFILAQVIIPRSNVDPVAGRLSKIRVAKNTTHFVLGDANSPRGYFTNIQTDSDLGAQVQYARKQKLNDVTLTGLVLSTTDTDRWIDFETDFPTNTTVTVVGAGVNDGDYSITDRTSTTLTVTPAFPAPGPYTNVQVYIKNTGTSEYFLFDQGQWVTEDIIEAPYDAVEGFGYGFDVDINTRGDLVAVGNKPTSNSISNEVSIIERARSDWRRISRLQPLTPANAASIGNDNYGGSGHSVAIGGSGDYILIGADDRRSDQGDANTEFGAVFEYWSILGETGSYEIELAPALNGNIKALQNVSFHQRSLITASGHTFEYVGSGTNMFTAIPQNGGVPKKQNEIQFDSVNAATPNFGLVYFTATDERGDFRIGEDLTINREQGNITGVTFDRSLFAVLTPFILALEG